MRGWEAWRKVTAAMGAATAVLLHASTAFAATGTGRAGGSGSFVAPPTRHSFFPRVKQFLTAGLARTGSAFDLKEQTHLTAPALVSTAVALAAGPSLTPAAIAAAMVAALLVCIPGSADFRNLHRSEFCRMLEDARRQGRPFDVEAQLRAVRVQYVFFALGLALSNLLLMDSLRSSWGLDPFSSAFGATAATQGGMALLHWAWNALVGGLRQVTFLRDLPLAFMNSGKRDERDSTSRSAAPLPWMRLPSPSQRSMERQNVWEKLQRQLNEDFALAEIRWDTLPSDRTPQALGRYLADHIHLQSREWKVRQPIHWPSYVIALGMLLEDEREGTAVKAGPLLQRLADAAWPDAVPAEELTLGANRRPDLHFRASAAVKAWPKTIVYQGKNPIFYLFATERKIEITDGDDPHRNLIERAVKRLQNWAPPELVPSDPEFPEFAARLPDLLDRLTIAQVDAPTPLLFADPGSLIVRPMNIGRHRGVIYIPKGFLADFDMGEPDDVDELAAFLIHQIEWIYKFQRSHAHSSVHANVHESLLVHTLRFVRENRYGLSNISAFRSRLHRLVRLQLQAEAVVLVPLFLSTRRRAAAMATRLRDEGAMEPKIDITHRWDFRSLFQAMESLGLWARIMGDEGAAESFFAEAPAWNRQTGIHETGILPITEQMDLAASQLGAGDYERFSTTLRALLTGEGFPIPPNCTPEMLEATLSGMLKLERVLKPLHQMREILAREIQREEEETGGVSASIRRMRFPFAMLEAFLNGNQPPRKMAATSGTEPVSLAPRTRRPKPPP
jgi:hypothetical protein